MLAAHVATLNQSPRNPIPNKENSRGTIRDFSFAQAMGHRVIRNAVLWLATTLQLSCMDRHSPYRPANRLQALRVCCREACDCCRPGIAGCNRRKLQRVPGPLWAPCSVTLLQLTASLAKWLIINASAWERKIPGSILLAKRFFQGRVYQVIPMT